MNISNFNQRELKYLLLIMLFLFFTILNVFNFFTPLENKIYDLTLLFRHLLVEPEISDVVFLSIDNNTIKELGPWPIERSYYAEVIRKLEDAEVSAIGLDIILSNHSSNESDKELIDILSRYRNIVIPVVANFRKQNIGIGKHRLFDFSFEEPYRGFTENATLGHINYPADRDGIIRKLIPIIGDKQNKYESFAVELVEKAGLEKLQLDLDDLNRELLIAFPGPSDIIPTISFLDIIEGDYDPFLLKDRIVVIGVNSVGIGDRYMTPFSRYGYMTGSQIHVQTISSIINGDLKNRVPYFINVIIYILVFFIFIILFFRFNPFKSTLILFIYFFLYSIIYLILFRYNLISAYVTQGLLVIGIYIISIINWYLYVKNEKLELIEAFEHYLSPDVMQQLLKNPAEVSLGGEETYLTVIFVDIRDFTRYAENRSAEQMVQSLNDFFEKIVAIIFKHGGTLDTFLGDGLMAFFGAPLEMKDHEKRAVNTALEIQSLQVPFELGIGVNSGYVIAGNIGSSNRLEYTVIGDVVNKAARFVDIAKPGEIVIGAETYFALKENAVLLKWWRDRVEIKGSSKVTEVYRF